jgi:hypothetical protein
MGGMGFGGQERGAARRGDSVRLSVVWRGFGYSKLRCTKNGCL